MVNKDEYINQSHPSPPVFTAGLRHAYADG